MTWDAWDVVAGTLYLAGHTPASMATIPTRHKLMLAAWAGMGLIGPFAEAAQTWRITEHLRSVTHTVASIPSVLAGKRKPPFRPTTVHDEHPALRRLGY